jgi:hypothetical protein
MDPTEPRLLLVDAANVVGSRPNGWWRDRPGAARGLVGRIGRAVDDGTLTGPVTVVLEGQARRGAPAGPAHDAVEVVHAPGSGDDTIAEIAACHGESVTVVTADRALGARVRATGGSVIGPTALLDRLPA